MCNANFLNYPYNNTDLDLLLFYLSPSGVVLPPHQLYYPVMKDKEILNVMSKRISNTVFGMIIAGNLLNFRG